MSRLAVLRLSVAALIAAACFGAAALASQKSAAAMAKAAAQFVASLSGEQKTRAVCHSTATTASAGTSFRTKPSRAAA